MISALRFLQWAFLVIFFFCFYLTLAEIFKVNTFLSRLNCETPEYDNKENFDPSLRRLNTIASLEKYCDSLTGTERINARTSLDIAAYASAVNEVIRKKFYHGYSCYGFSNNYWALLLAPVFNKHLNAIVLPEDIVKYPYAACSQQAIVAMTLLQRKHITTRKVGFKAGPGYDGHFCFEAFYDGRWHFFDTDIEPDDDLLSQSGQPSIAVLSGNDSLLLKAYYKLLPNKTLNLFKNYFYGEPNVPPAPNATFFQRCTKILSFVFWILPLAASFFCRRIYLRLQVHKKCVEFPGLSQLA